MSRQESNMSIDEKEWYSFLIIPAVPAAILSAFSLASGSLLASVLIFTGAYLVAGAHVLVLGVPIFLLGKRLNAIHWWSCILAAFLIGGIPMGIWDGWRNFIPFALFGASGGLVFWLLWEFWIHEGR
jgi:hypothetical protein